MVGGLHGDAEASVRDSVEIMRKDDGLLYFDEARVQGRDYDSLQ